MTFRSERGSDPSRLRALARVAAAYAVVQAASYLVLASSFDSGLAELWVHGALGPLAAVEAVARFRYHSALANAGFVVLCLAIALAPLVHVARPRPATLAASVVALVVWCLFGLGFSIDHM